MTSTDVIAILAIVVPILGAIIGYLIKRVTAAEAKNEILRDSNAELKRQIDKLEITGSLVNRFFSQLPANNEVIKREIQS